MDNYNYVKLVTLTLKSILVWKRPCYTLYLLKSWKINFRSIQSTVNYISFWNIPHLYISYILYIKYIIVYIFHFDLLIPPIPPIKFYDSCLFNFKKFYRFNIYCNKISPYVYSIITILIKVIKLMFLLIKIRIFINSREI